MGMDLPLSFLCHIILAVVYACFRRFVCLEKVEGGISGVSLFGYHLFYYIPLGSVGFCLPPFLFRCLFVASLMGENLYHEAWIPLEITKHLLNHHRGFCVWRG
jgi:hypothetical protein